MSTPSNQKATIATQPAMSTLDAVRAVKSGTANSARVMAQLSSVKLPAPNQAPSAQNVPVPKA